MKKMIAHLVFLIYGWKSDYPKEYKIPKTVMIAAPHTSNWDLIFALAVYWKEGIKAQFLIKDSYTKGLKGYFLDG